MSRRAARRLSLLIPVILASLTACQDSISPERAPRPKLQLAQGDNGTWTVNSLADPGDGVCDDAACTLREAIAAAAAGGKIVFAAGLQGTVDLTSGQLQIAGKSLDIDGDGRISVDANISSRVLEVFGGPTSPTTVKLAGLTFENGDAAIGAGILIRDATATLDRVTLLGNIASLNGGAIAVLTIGPATNVTIKNSIITRNGAIENGGGIYVGSGSSVTILNTTVERNASDGDGGGLFNAGTALMVASTVSENESNDGGGIFSGFGGTTTIKQSTVSSNKAFAFGGGAINAGTLRMSSVTITANEAQNAGGLGNGAGILSVANSIVAGNTGVGECDGAVTSLGHNLTTTVSSCGFSAATDKAVAASTVFSEVLERELKDNGGPTRTHALVARGRAVDAGYCPGETTDQRGFARPADDPLMPNALDGCDMGAYELQGPVAAVADLMISQSVDKSSVKAGDKLTYTVRVQNLGPQTAPNVVVANVLSSGVTFLEARANKGTLTAPPVGETGTVTWSIGDMLNQANEFVEIRVTVLVKGKTTITNTATVTGNVADPNAANNTAAITVSVGAGSKGGPSR
jgi:uncharacterized repeat protein (TIGR01451 family)/CSLREA domain-containing protein